MNIKKEMKKVGMAAMFTLAMTTGLFAQEGDKKEMKNEDAKMVMEAPAYTINLTINGVMIELSPIDVYANSETEKPEVKNETVLENDELAMVEDADSFYEKMRIEEAIDNLDYARLIF